MKYVLFVGSRVGYEAIKILIELQCKLEFVFIEKEHEHEREKYYERSEAFCKKNGISYFINASNKTIKEKVENIDELDYLISFGYRRMIDQIIIDKSIRGALGTHFSPLPRYRGFAPLNWVLINGETETAVNLFCLDEEVDSGDIIASRRVKIDYSDDINTLYEKCITNFKNMMQEVIPRIESNTITPVSQDESKATYLCARNPEDGLINWDDSSTNIYNLVRAVTYPFPGAFTFLEGEKITILSCEEYQIPKYEGVVPGKVIKRINNQGVVVLCGIGAVLIKKIADEKNNVFSADKLITSIRSTLGKK